MIDYVVGKDKNNAYRILGNLDQNTVLREIPSSNPHKKRYVDLFLHKADIDRGIQFLNLVSENNDITINEALFIAGLNNCMKCFKRSKSRKKLDKSVVFASTNNLLSEFEYFERLRDKHYDHDENGMVQTTAFLFVSVTDAGVFFRQPSVVWNRIKLDFCSSGHRLLNIMCAVQHYLREEIDATGREIMSSYKGISASEILNWKPAILKPATDQTERCE